MTICSGYTDPTVCISAKSTANDTCVWENSTCRARACKDAPKALKTDEGCVGYLAGLDVLLIQLVILVYGLMLLVLVLIMLNVQI
jgi:hypothetical protein